MLKLKYESPSKTGDIIIPLSFRGATQATSAHGAVIDATHFHATYGIITPPAVYKIKRLELWIMGGATLADMYINIKTYWGADGEPYNNSGANHTDYNLGNVVNFNMYKYDLTAFIAGIPEFNHLRCSLEYNATVGHETDAHANGFYLYY